MGDANLDFARRATLAGRQTHRLLAWVDGQLFQKQLGQWVWYKDLGNQEFQQTLSEKRWKHLAYEVDEKDHECYIPWGPLFWFVAFPFSLYAQLYWRLEGAWTPFALYSGTGTSESRRWLLLLHSLFGH